MVVQKKEFLFRYRSLWGALKARQRDTRRAAPLTEVMKWRLQQDIDRAYTQCVIDVSPLASEFSPTSSLLALDLSL
jgi:hypothetical protein